MEFTVILETPRKVEELKKMYNAGLKSMSCLSPASHATIDFELTKTSNLSSQATLFQSEKDTYLIIGHVRNIYTILPLDFNCVAHVPSKSTIFIFNSFRGGTLSVSFNAVVAGCAAGRYGGRCEKDCICKNGARCHSFNGACLCTPGWKGVACDIPTPDVFIRAIPQERNYVSGNLTLVCTAVNVENISIVTITFRSTYTNMTETLVEDTANTTEYQIHFLNSSSNGVYVCSVTIMDGTTHQDRYVLNVSECPPNRYGEHCEKLCDCENGGRCERLKGCVCVPGWTDAKCNTSCPAGTFGQDCQEHCRCNGTELCDPVNGTCNLCRGETCTETGRSTGAGRRNSDELYALSGLFVVPIAFMAGVIICRKKWRQTVKEMGTYLLNQSEQAEEMHNLISRDTIDKVSRWELKEDDLVLERLVGQGCFGNVVLARLNIPDAEPVMVAAKSVSAARLEQEGDAQWHRDFYREADILITVHEHAEVTDGEERPVHPNIVRLYGVITESRPKRIVLEYAAQGDLLAYLRKSRDIPNITLKDLVGLAVGVARALQELEVLQIVHRDVAARNVLVTDDNVAKLADFGLARDVYTDTMYVRTHQAGRDEPLPLKWMSLEALRDGEYTCQSDVWSFGVLLWEIATRGEEPHYSDVARPSCRHLVWVLKEGGRLERPDGCPMELYRLMSKCWHANPHRRPSAATIEQKLNNFNL
ncbi:proto-oncogene tyrosine-protein kinase receptor Ret-like [Branchiostoma floridae]|uniref:Proto-oncogene tyrosine-protein kinase receptor Ret-like n=1 Tax=Branchiostoma floridae TaxID=7739 RepID=A0A9J7LSB3_BRAFL|nr:proto-oncogene tyrosine-protein kinase receptor Ret-like [Branchiostoma floridae]